MTGPVARAFDSAIPEIRELLSSRGVRLAYVFGSAARGTEREDSDLDLAVFLGRGVSPEEAFNLRLDLTTTLVGLTHQDDVDVVVLDHAPPVLAFEVIDTGRLFLGDEIDRVEFEVQTIQRYIDTRPLRELAEARLDRKIREREPSREEDRGAW